MPTLMNPPSLKIKVPIPPSAPPQPPRGGGEGRPEPPVPPPPRQHRSTDFRVLLADRIATWGIKVGGVAIVASVLGILVFILATVLPLFRGARAGFERAYALPAPVVAAAQDETRSTLLALLADGRWVSLDGPSGRSATAQTLAGWPKGALATCGQAGLGGRLALGLADGRAWTGQASFRARWAEGKAEAAEAGVNGGALQVLDPRGLALATLADARSEGGETLAGIGRDGHVSLFVREVPFAGAPAIRRPRLDLEAAWGTPTCLALDDNAQKLWLGTDQGRLLVFSLQGAKPALVGQLRAFEDQGVGVLSLAYGQSSVILGGTRGGLASAMAVPNGQARTWTLIRRFDPMPSAVAAIAISPRDKGFTVYDRQGGLQVCFLTTGHTLLRIPPAAGFTGPDFAAMAPKADGLLAGSGAELRSWWLRNPHPEMSWRSLFGKVWYEGYPEPDYVWQSTGGSDDFEQKFSLMPLIYGTLKGAFFALLFAVPLALLAAIYTSQFMHPDLRRAAKPAIELMAALPSVVLGFLAALVLAPFLERNIFTVILGVVAVPFIALASLFAWRLAPGPWQRRVGPDGEFAVMGLGLLLGLALVGLLGHPLEQATVGDLKVWMLAHWGLRYDPRNSLVVGFAMGFAVIPIIYTICEDALSSVPRHLVSASLSAGATPWQTAWRVVVPVALSGIFSAAMVGFGRAVGETMVVLMATGNTPVMDPSIFTGFRSLAANIAVEIPEAPMGGSLYRVLFLAALLLFAMTFVVKTAAEVIRLHLRKKYSQL